jgi:hypothetical protein
MCIFTLELITGAFVALVYLKGINRIYPICIHSYPIKSKVSVRKGMRQDKNRAGQCPLNHKLYK